MLKLKTIFINAEGQNNTYKKINDMLKVRNTSINQSISQSINQSINQNNIFSNILHKYSM